MAPYMEPDEYSHSSIRNLYLDTPDFRLIRRSLERPVYKEKLRVRSYRRAGLEEPVFVELKKKYGSVVYKRRLAMPQREALDCIAGSASWPEPLTWCASAPPQAPPERSVPSLWPWGQGSSPAWAISGISCSNS